MNDQQQADKQKVFKIIDNYLIDTNSLLGCGQYGNVYKGYEVNNYGRIYAIKETLLSRKNVNVDTFNKKKDAAIREINSLKELNHPNVIRFINAKKTDKHLYLIMEYCKAGSLESYIEEHMPEEKECLYLFSQIVDAFKYLIKEKKRRHGDIKPANILLSDGKIKLADFGFSKQFAEESEQFFSYTGSPLYTALQILEGQVYTTKSEIWSLGITLHFMLCYNPLKRELSFPWWGGTDVHLVRNIKASPQLKFSQENEEKLSPQIQQLLHRMLQVDEDKRMDWDELFSCPIFTFDFAQEIIYNEYQDEENEIDKTIINIPSKKDQSKEFHQQITASFINNDTNQITTSQLKSNEESRNLTSSQNTKNTQIGVSINQQLNTSYDEEENIRSMMRSTKKITSIDVTHQQIYRGDNCLKNIEEGEQNSKLMQNLRDYIQQERQLSFFVYHTTKMFKESFERLQLYFSSQIEAQLFESKVLFVLCKRTKVIAQELLNDIGLKRSGQLIRGVGNSISVGTQGQTNPGLQQSKQNQMGYQNNMITSNMNNGITSQKKIQVSQQLGFPQRSLRSPQLTLIIANNSNNYAQTKNVAQNQNIIISKEHWNVFSNNQNMKQTYEQKLKFEASVYSENFKGYKSRFQKMLNQKSYLENEDRQMAFSEDDTNINQNYEANVVGQVLQILLYELQRITNKIQHNTNSRNDLLSQLNDEDLRQIYLIDDLFMIYTFDATFRSSIFLKKNEKINIQQFYFLRKHSNPLFLIQRLTQAYRHLFIPQ